MKVGIDGIGMCTFLSQASLMEGWADPGEE